jgi:hypothetical protein
LGAKIGGHVDFGGPETSWEQRFKENTMSEYMLLVRNEADHSDAWAPERHRAFLKACEAYIADLQRAGHLIAAQPLMRSGAIVAKRDGAFAVAAMEKKGELQVGYYHVRAVNLDEAVAIAKRNPELEYSATARIEVRPIKTGEAETGFDYPTHA